MNEIPSVVSVRPLARHRVRLRFDDGVEGIAELAPLMRFQGVFAPMRSPSYFAKVRVVGKSIAWPNDADLDPVVLYSLVTGKTVKQVFRDRDAALRRKRR